MVGHSRAEVPVSLSLPDFALSDEQREFRDTLRRFLTERAPISEVRRLLASDRSDASELWSQGCRELGLAGLALAEADGGQGFGLKELAIASTEIGRSLAPMPLLASAGLAARAVAAVAEARERREWLPAIAEGRVATLAWIDRLECPMLEAVTSEFRSTPSGSRLRGVKRVVLDAHRAERIFVVARAPGSKGLDGLGLFCVEANAPGLEVDPVESFDPTRPLSNVRLEDAPAAPVGPLGEAGAGLARGLEEAAVLLCAEIIGGMERVLEMAVDHATQRVQFGRPIGSFQAIKHKCADMLIDFEGARTATEAAIVAIDGKDPERSILASVAKAHAGPAYVRMATENIQIHGGVGYTWEYDPHLYYRRAHSCEILVGDAAEHRERIARALESELASESTTDRATEASAR